MYGCSIKGTVLVSLNLGPKLTCFGVSTWRMWHGCNGCSVILCGNCDSLSDVNRKSLLDGLRLMSRQSFLLKNEILFVTGNTGVAQGDVLLWNLTRGELFQDDDGGRNVSQSWREKFRSWFRGTYFQSQADYLTDFDNLEGLTSVITHFLLFNKMFTPAGIVSDTSSACQWQKRALSLDVTLTVADAPKDHCSYQRVTAASWDDLRDGFRNIW